MNELIGLEARQVLHLLERREITPLDLVEAAEARIAAVDPRLNALPTLCVERARDHARRLMREPPPAVRGRGWLAGIPLAVKDLNDVSGVRTTYGSPLFAEHIPDGSDVMVETLEANGGIVIAKSNTPEFGHGANTFNRVFGKTRNPWNTAMTCGGSSGGSAVAVASGMTWLATGSDLGCSLRTPAAFCSVVGLRPSPGRVARSRVRLPYDNLWVQGPMARTVGDAALMLDAMAGEHPLDPISLPLPERPFLDAVTRPLPPKRVAWSRDLGGITPVSGEVADVCERAARRFAEMGAEVEEACPDLSGARAIFHVLRAYQFAGDLGEVLRANRDRVREEVLWNLEKGERLSAADLAHADRQRGLLYAEVARFFRDYDLLLTPATVVAPFDIEITAVKEVDGREFENYFDWYTIAYAITVTSLPALSLPCGFTRDGLPVGLQIVGPPRGEAPLLSAAALMEDLLQIPQRLPVAPTAHPARS